MERYHLFFSGKANEQLESVRLRAIQSGVFDEFETDWRTIRRALSDPRGALNVGQFISLTESPILGGYFCQWRRGCFYVRYVVFPDAEEVSFLHIEFSPPD